MKTQHTTTARYTLHIVADTGYESTTDGDCTPHQYSMAIATLRGAPHTSQELQAQRDELLAALKSVLNWIDDNCETSGFDAVEAQADAAIAKAEGGTP